MSTTTDKHGAQPARVIEADVVTSLRDMIEWRDASIRGETHPKGEVAIVTAARAALAAHDLQRQEAASRAMRIEQGVPRYIVDGREFPNEESNYMADGRYPPFVVFDVDKQENLPGEYGTRDEAEQVARANNEAQLQQQSDGKLPVALALPGSVEEVAKTSSRMSAGGAVGQLAHVVRDAIRRFDRLGFIDPDAPVDGGDCVDLVGEVLPRLRTTLAGLDWHLPAVADLGSHPDAEERKRLSDFLVEDWKNSFADNADAAFAATADLLRDGHVGYAHMPIEHLRYEAENAGYDDELDDEPEGMKP